MGFVKRKNAQAFLFVNAFLWGSSYVWSKMLLGYLPRFSILFLCALGGLVSTCILFRKSIKNIKPGTVAISIGITVFSILSNTCFMFALQYTGSSNTAFIVQMSVVITPVIMAVFERKMPQGRILLGAVIALCGLFLLTCDFTSFRLNKGDIFALGNAVFFSLFLASQNLASKKIEPVHFTFVHHATNTIAFFFIALLWEAHSVSLQNLKSPAFIVLIAANMLVSIVTILLQSTAIKFVRPEKATLIYTLEPVTALLLAFVLIGEKLDGLKSVLGCAFILLSVVFSLYTPKARRERRANTDTSTKPVWE